MEELVKKILEYMAKGYSINDVMDAMKDIFASNEDKYYLLVKNTFDKARKGMPAEEYEKILNLRKVRSEEAKKAKIKAIADKVKERAEANTTALTLKDALAQAAKNVSMHEDVSYDTCRNYTKIIYPDFYEYYSNNKNMDEKYLIDLAEKIIEKNMTKTIAVALPGYSRMINYIKENRPDLYEKINETYASHVAYDTRNYNQVSSNQENYTIFNNKDLLIDILLEYRIPFDVAVEFINANADVFLNGTGVLTVENFYENLKLASYHKKVAVLWYLAEMVNKDQYTDYRLERFNNFVLKFNILKSDIKMLERFLLAEGGLKYSVKQKITSRKYKESLNLNQEELRSMLKFVYKNGFTDDDFEYFLGYQGTSKSRFIEMLKDTDNADDQMLIYGLNKLNEYKLDQRNRTGRN